MHAQALTAVLASQLTTSEQLVEQSLSQDPIQRYYAAKAIAELGPVDPAFIPALHHIARSAR